jgi:hypothetical protein
MHPLNHVEDVASAFSAKNLTLVEVDNNPSENLVSAAPDKSWRFVENDPFSHIILRHCCAIDWVEPSELNAKWRAGCWILRTVPFANFAPNWDVPRVRVIRLRPTPASA